MPVFPRSQPTVGLNPTPTPSVSTSPGEIVGRAIEKAGTGLGTFVAAATKEREDLDSFEAKIKLQKFKNDQDLRQAQYDDSITGDGRDHTAVRVREFDQEATNLVQGLPNNPKTRQFAALTLEGMRGHYGEQSYRTQTNHLQRFQETELGNFALAQVVPKVGADVGTVKEALTLLETTLGGTNISDVAKDRVRRQAVGQIVERWLEKGDVDQREQADAILKEYTEKAPKAADRVIVGGRDLEALVAIHPSLTAGSRNKDIDQLSSPFVSSFARMLNAMPPELRESLEINEAHRSSEYQAELYRRFRAGGPLAASPGKSRHEFGEAVDLSPRGGWTNNNPTYQKAIAWIYANGRAYGIENPESIRGRDPAHFQLTAEGRSAPPEPVKAAGRSVSVQYADASGAPASGDFDLTRSDGLLAHAVATKLGRIDDLVAKRREELDAAVKVQAWVSGGGGFNPHDAESRKIVDKAFAQSSVAAELFAGNELAMLRAVEVAHKLNYVPEKLSQAVEGLIGQNDPDKRVMGLRMASAILAKQPHALDAVKGASEVKRQALDYAALTGVRGLDPREALARLDEMSSPEWKLKEEARKKEVTGDRSFVTAIDESDLRSVFDQSSLPFTAPGLPAIGGDNVVLLETYRKAVREHYIRHGDEALAKSLAAGEMKRMWGVSRVTGTALVTKYPVERFYTTGQGDAAYITDQLKADVKERTGKDVDLGNVAIRADERTQREVANPGRDEDGKAQPPRPSYVVIYKDPETGVPQTLPGRWRPDIDKAQAAEAARFKAERGEAMEGELRKDAVKPYAPHLLLRRGGRALWDWLKGKDPGTAEASQEGSP